MRLLLTIFSIRSYLSSSFEEVVAALILASVTVHIVIGATRSQAFVLSTVLFERRPSGGPC